MTLAGKERGEALDQIDAFYDGFATMMHAQLCGKVDKPSSSRAVPGLAFEAVPRTVAQALKTNANPTSWDL